MKLKSIILTLVGKTCLIVGSQLLNSTNEVFLVFYFCLVSADSRLISDRRLSLNLVRVPENTFQVFFNLDILC